MYLNHSYLYFRSLLKRDYIRERHRNYFRKVNADRRARRQRLARERRERGLMRVEGGRSYRSCSFGEETFTRPSKKPTSKRGRGKATQVSTKGKGVKRPLIPSFDSDDPIHSQDSDTTPIVMQVQESATSVRTDNRLRKNAARSLEGLR